MDWHIRSVTQIIRYMSTYVWYVYDMELSSLAALEFVKMTIAEATTDGNFVKNCIFISACMIYLSFVNINTVEKESQAIQYWGSLSFWIIVQESLSQVTFF